MTIDLTPLVEFVGLPAFSIIWRTFLFLIGAFLLFIIAKLIWRGHLDRVDKKYLADQKYILLAIDVPKDNEQGPEVVEKMFAHFAGIKKPRTWADKYIHGKQTLTISPEIISIAGHVQFLIRTPVQFRELVEAAVYAAYPDAGITEVEDYTENVPDEFPDEEYDLWGADLVLYNKNPYSIRTYVNFEQGVSKELNDPLVDLLEILGRLGKGEQVWLQFNIKPIGTELKKQADTLIKKLKGEKERPSRFTEFMKIAFPQATPAEVKKEEMALLLKISPGEKAVIEALEKKVAKIAFETRIRLIYIAEKDAFSKDRGVSGVLGALNQFNTLDMNGLEPDEKARTVRGVFGTAKKLARKQTLIMDAYRKRKYKSWVPKKLGRKIADFFKKEPFRRKYILNIEELATLYHFPVVTVKAPLIKKTGSKRGEPPIGLPME